MLSGYAWILLNFAISACGTAGARRYALNRSLIDTPGDRRSHVVATPRGGGIAIVVMLLLSGAWLVFIYPQQRGMLLLSMAGLAMVSGIGWWDDHRPLSPWIRLAVHAVAAGLLSVAVWFAAGSAWQAAAAFLLVMILVNVWNFMDGINGLAASQAAIAGAALAFVLPGPWNWLAAALAAASMGFLPFNFPRARIFLGDVGSGGIGYMVALLIVAGLPAGPVAGIWLCLPACAFLVDAGFTLGWRILKGERWWSPHVQHVYQRCARHHGHTKITIAYALFSLMASIWMLIGSRSGTAMDVGFAAGWYLLAAIVWLAIHGKKRE